MMLLIAWLFFQPRQQFARLVLFRKMKFNYKSSLPNSHRQLLKLKVQQDFKVSFNQSTRLNLRRLTICQSSSSNAQSGLSLSQCSKIYILQSISFQLKVQMSLTFQQNLCR